MTVRELSLSNQIVYVSETYKSMSLLIGSSILFGFTNLHDGSRIYNIDLGIYNISMSNSLLLYRNNEPFWSLPINEYLAEVIIKNKRSYLLEGCSKDMSFQSYDYKESIQGWAHVHFNTFEIPNEKLFNYSVAMKIINRTIYPRYTPSSSGGLSGIIQ